MRKMTATLLVLSMITTLAYSQKDKKESNKKDKSENQKEKDENAKDDEKIYNKLINLYTLDKFPACIETADKYIKNDNTARSPYPYLYTSMSYLGIYNDKDNYDLKKFKDPLRKALGFMGRFKKKDKNGELQKENAVYLLELRKAALMESANMNEKKDYKNLQNLARDMAKNYDKDVAMQIISGVYLCRADAKIDGERSIDAGMNLLKKKKDEGSAKLDQTEADFLADSFIMYTDFLMEIKDAAKAKAAIQFAKDMLPENEKVNRQSEKLSK